jgi:D-tyrosyl-tRNA(Tyr) deacylase
MGKRLLSVSGASATYLHDEQDGKQVIQTVTDVTAVLERAKTLHNEGKHRTGMGDSHMASIPVSVLAAWAQGIGKNFADVMSDDALMTRFLTDPNNKFFIIDPTSVPR